MNLLLKRGQSNALSSKVTFNLWAQTELDDDERHIVQRYRFDNAVLINIEQPDLFRTSAGVGFAAFAFAYLLLWSTGMPLPLFISAVAGAAAGYFYYDRKRESVLVADLIHGRDFTCVSIVDIARKEAWIKSVAAVFRQVMETAKQWGGTETIPIDALSAEEAKYIAIKSLF
jgi:hypothetical protein